MSDMPTLSELEDGINYYLKEAKKYNLDVYLGTLLPIHGWRTFTIEKEEFKNEFNLWLKKHKCIDFASLIGIFEEGSYRFKVGCDSGDHLHPSKYAYELMARLVLNEIYKK